VKLSVFQIKLLHSAIFWGLSLCIVYVLFCGLSDRVTIWTWWAIGLLMLESLVFVGFGWRCPLTLLAEQRGAGRGTVTDIFLPKWFADRIPPICGTLYATALVLVIWRAFFS
jgi:hypothetical protein